MAQKKWANNFGIGREQNGGRWRGSVIGSDKEYKGAIYRIWSVANRKSYVGQSSNPWERERDGKPFGYTLGGTRCPVRWEARKGAH